MIKLVLLLDNWSVSIRFEIWQWFSSFIFYHNKTKISINPAKICAIPQMIFEINVFLPFECARAYFLSVAAYYILCLSKIILLCKYTFFI